MGLYGGQVVITVPSQQEALRFDFQSEQGSFLCGVRMICVFSGFSGRLPQSQTTRLDRLGLGVSVNGV